MTTLWDLINSCPHSSIGYLVYSIYIEDDKLLFMGGDDQET
jgi:hypothetical protein